MSDLSRLYLHETETLHRTLYGVHDDIYFRALKKIGAALLVLRKIEDNLDLRQQCRSYIAEFESLRDQLEALGRNAAELRSKLIRENGCNGSCESNR